MIGEREIEEMRGLLLKILFILGMAVLYSILGYFWALLMLS
jgi:hypothetical protein